MDDQIQVESGTIWMHIIGSTTNYGSIVMCYCGSWDAALSQLAVWFRKDGSWGKAVEG